jgi:hypothetical protein
MFVSGWSPYASSYSYVNNRPTLFTDPSGLCFLWLPHNEDGSCWGHGIADVVRYVVSSPFTAVGLAMGEISGTCSFDEANLVVLCTGEDPVPRKPLRDHARQHNSRGGGQSDGKDAPPRVRSL